MNPRSDLQKETFMRQNHPNGLSWNNLKIIILRNSFSEIFGNAEVSLRDNRNNRRTIWSHLLSPISTSPFWTNIYALLIQEFCNRKSLNVKNVGKTSVIFYFLVITKELILKKNFLNVRSVGRPLFIAYNLTSENS